jgi:Zn finger protein HypA/HybF involved in hydrogenase expression
MTQLSYKISIPTDQGFWGRECKVCNKYFKIDYEKIKDDLYCPYCGVLQPNDNLWTKKQEDVVNKIAQEVGKRIIEDELEKMFRDLARGNNFMTYRPGTKTQISKPKLHLEKEVDTQIECSKCKMSFQVFGIFGFCPGCRQDNILIYEANLTLLIQEIDNSSDKSRALRHAYNDFVSTFESYCKNVAEKYNLGYANFQNLKNAKELFKKYGLNIYNGLSDKELIKIKRVFEKRHAYQHAKGKITQEFTKNIPEDSKLIGTIAVLDKDEFLEAIDIMKKILKNITNKYGS